MNLPNSITVARIAATPLIAALPFAPGTGTRLAAFLLFVMAAVTDYWDGHLARTRNLVTDLGRLLDPLADKLLLVATLVPMYWLMRGEALLLQRDPAAALGTASAVHEAFAFVTPAGIVTLPLWVVALVLGREAFMTGFRQLAARRGTVIAAIGPAKWKTAFQSIWVGSAYFWFFAASLALHRGWEARLAWQAFAQFNGLVGAAAMVGAVGLTLWSLGLYLRRYGHLLRPAAAR